MQLTKRNLILEVGIATITLVVITSILHVLQSITFIGKFYGLIFALMFLYVPAAIIRKMGRKIDFLDGDAHSYLKSALIFLITSVIIFPLFLLAAHGWEKVVYNAEGPVFAMMPQFWKILAYQFIMVSLPEEFFFRGYVQSTLNQVFPRKWRLLGANLGWAWIITAAAFAVAHSVVVLEWWHFSIFFPALLFGYLREKTGSITAPILFHGAANIIMNWLGYLYAY